MLSHWFFVGLARTRWHCYPVFGGRLFTDCSQGSGVNPSIETNLNGHIRSVLRARVRDSRLARLDARVSFDRAILNVVRLRNTNALRVIEEPDGRSSGTALHVTRRQRSFTLLGWGARSWRTKLNPDPPD